MVTNLPDVFNPDIYAKQYATTYTRTALSSQTVPCGFCGAFPNVPCNTRVGRPHAARVSVSQNMRSWYSRNPANDLVRTLSILFADALLVQVTDCEGRLGALLVPCPIESCGAEAFAPCYVQSGGMHEARWTHSWNCKLMVEGTSDLTLPWVYGERE